MRKQPGLTLARQIDDMTAIGFDPVLGALMRAHVAAPPAPISALPRLTLDVTEVWQRQTWLRLPLPLLRWLAGNRDPRALSLRGPFTLLLLGSFTGLIATPGPWPGAVAVGSLLLAALVFRGAVYLAERGRAWIVVASLVIGSLLGLLLCLGPQPLPYCKVTAFNAWAFALATHLPDLGLPATNPNAIAGALAVALAFVFAGALHGRTRQRRILAAITAALLTLCLMVTASRTAWLAAAAGMALVAANRGRRRALLVLAIAGALIVALLAVDPTLRSPATLAARGNLWRATLALICAQPLTGLGFGRTAYLSPLAATAVHNALLQLWTDAGFLGLVGLVWLAVRTVRGRKALARRRLQPGWALAGIDGALAAFAVQGLFESNILFAFKITSVQQAISPLPLALLGLLVGLDHYARHLAQMHARIPARRITPARRSAPIGVWRATLPPLPRSSHVNGTNRQGLPLAATKMRPDE